MARPTLAQLQAQLDELSAANAELRDQLAARDRAVAEAERTLAAANGADRSVASSGPRPDRRGRAGLFWRRFGSVVIIVLAAVLAPVALVASWAGATLTDTDRFVETYAPLAQDPSVQAFVVTETTAAIDGALDLENLTTSVIDGIVSLGTPPAATVALEALKGPAVAGLRSAIEQTVTTVVTADAFHTVWQEALRLSHQQLTSALAGDPDAALQIGSDGTIGVQLAPIVEAVKATLVDNGFGLAAQIPEINQTIQLAQDDSITQVRVAAQATVTLGTWLPWIVVALFVAGVILAPRRSVATIGAGLALAISMAVCLAIFAVVQSMLSVFVPPTQVPTDVMTAVYTTVTDPIRDTSATVLMIAIAVAIVAWAAAPLRTPTRLRALAQSGFAAVRKAAARHGVTTGAFGDWLGRHSTLVRSVIGVVAALVVLFVRPLTTSLVVTTVLLVLLALLLLELLRRPPGESDAPLTTSDADAAPSEAAETVAPETDSAVDDADRVDDAPVAEVAHS